MGDAYRSGRRVRFSGNGSHRHTGATGLDSSIGRGGDVTEEIGIKTEPPRARTQPRRWDGQVASEVMGGELYNPASAHPSPSIDRPRACPPPPSRLEQFQPTKLRTAVWAATPSGGHDSRQPATFLINLKPSVSLCQLPGSHRCDRTEPLIITVDGVLTYLLPTLGNLQEGTLCTCATEKEDRTRSVHLWLKKNRLQPSLHVWRPRPIFF